MSSETEFTFCNDEFVIAEAILTADLRLELSGVSDAHPITLESVRMFSGESVPVFVHDFVAEWVKQNQPMLQSRYRDARRDRQEAA